MKAKVLKKFDVKISPEDPVFVIGIVSDMLDIPIWTLRKLDEMGVVKPVRRGKKIRCYTQTQITQLSYVQYLMDARGVNISGIKIILDLEGRNEDKNH